MISFDPTQEIPDELGALHFVGIGGSGMSGIARLFLAAGYTVTGSDVQENDNIRTLRWLGARVIIGHDAANVADSDTLVVTSALWEDNPEYVFARNNHIPVLHRSQALAWLTRNTRLIAVAGAHGKTTSTGMLVSALIALGEDPSFVNGGVIESLGTSAAAGSGELFVVEADESDGSFLLYDTAVALITNVDPDHLDHYGSKEAFEQAFVTFAQNAGEFVVVSSDDAGARHTTDAIRADEIARAGLLAAPLMPDGFMTDGLMASALMADAVLERRIITFGEDADATVRVHSVTSQGPVSFQLAYEGTDYPATLMVPGHHNALNAAGAFAVLVGLGFDPADALAGVATFGGTKRRFELHGTVRGVSVYDDYAHHPTEVAAALSAARTVVGSGRIIAVHQPHLYSRTRLFAREFAETLEQYADQTVVLDVCGAREDPEPGVTGELVAARFADASKVTYRPDWQDAAEYTASIAREGDFVITLGCGDVYRIVPQLLDALTRTSPGSGPAPADGLVEG